MHTLTPLSPRCPLSGPESCTALRGDRNPFGTASPAGGITVPMPKLWFDNGQVNQEQGKQGNAGGPSSASWVLVLPFSLQSSLWSSTGGGRGSGLSHRGSCSPGDCEEPKDKGVLGVSGAQEENILCKERGGGEAPQSWSTSPEDAGGHPGGVLEGAGRVELHCSQVQTGLCTHPAGRSGSRCPEAPGWSTPGGPSGTCSSG